MSIIDHRTTNRNYLLPDVANNLADDVARLSAALGAIDTDVGSLFASMSGKVDAPALAGYQSRSERNEANGYAGLNSAGQIDEQALPSSIKGGLVAKGNWNAAQNTPVIPVASAANRGWLYFVVADGTSAVNSGRETINDWAAGDALWSDGAAWHKLDSTDRVTSVAGRLGNVVLAPDDIAGLSAALAAINSSMAALAGNNDFTGLNSFSGDHLALWGSLNTASFDGAVFYCTNRNNPGRAGDDVIKFNGSIYNSAGIQKTITKIISAATNITAGAEAAVISFSNMVAGVMKAALHIGAGLWTPNAIGGDKGADSINARTYYADGVPLRRILSTERQHTVTLVTGFDFTIPPGTNYIELYFKGVSTSAAGGMLVQIGDTVPETTGYYATSSGGAGHGGCATDGFLIYSGSSDCWMGAMRLRKVDDNGWVSEHVLGIINNSWAVYGGGCKDVFALPAGAAAGRSATVSVLRVSCRNNRLTGPGHIDVICYS